MVREGGRDSRWRFEIEVVIVVVVVFADYLMFVVVIF